MRFAGQGRWIEGEGRDEVRSCVQITSLNFNINTRKEMFNMTFIAFDTEFTHLDEHDCQDLITLEQESAVYGELWDDEAEDFQHVRIEFTQDERREFLRRCIAYDIFLRSGSPRWAVGVPGIDRDIAEYADTYSLRPIDEDEIPAPYHCFAAFLGERLEELLCYTPRERKSMQSAIDIKLPWRYYVQEMIDRCGRVLAYTDGFDRARFVSDRLTYDATLRNIELISEAAKKLPCSVRKRHPKIPWKEIIGQRIIIAHKYWRVDDSIIWRNIQEDIPDLLPKLQGMLWPE